MRQNWKRYMAVVTMLVLVCAAAVLNWQATKNATPDSSDGQTDGKILGESTLVSGNDGSSDTQTGTAEDESSVYTGSDYFASARLTRQQARDNAVSLLQQAAEEDGATQAAKDQASEGIQAMAKYTMAEAQVENLVTAKGYKDCVAFMSDDSISVVVSTDSGKLTDEDVAKITDIAKTETGYAASSIRIMPAN